MSSAGEGATPSSAVSLISAPAAQQYFAPPHGLSNNPSTSQAQIDQLPPKKKRNLPGNPDPDAEVIVLSPKSLMATNRFVCEICSKGFQRDQNLQLHRRGHNLPWKLKQRENKEVIRKKVYVCPEPGCVHHDRSRALGDLTGIKKHYSRKHGEKKWKCDRCSKRYAVRSDWKAHSKICGTKEYRCDCGTLFSRRDSFITHRAFCDALAVESTRSIPNPLLIPSQSQQNHPTQTTQFNPQSQHQPQFTTFKQEEQQLCTTTTTTTTTAPTTITPPGTRTSFDQHQGHQLPPWLAPPPLVFPTSPDQLFSRNYANPNADPSIFSPAMFQPVTMLPSPNMSATALLQKAAQMGATMSSCASIQDMLMPSSYGNEAFGTGFGSIKDVTGIRVAPKTSGPGGISATVGGNGEVNLTRDFLGLRPVLHNDIFGMAGTRGLASEQIDQQQNQNQNQQIHKPWQGN